MGKSVNLFLLFLISITIILGLIPYTFSIKYKLSTMDLGLYNIKSNFEYIENKEFFENGDDGKVLLKGNLPSECIGTGNINRLSCLKQIKTIGGSINNRRF